MENGKKHSFSNCLQRICNIAAKRDGALAMFAFKFYAPSLCLLGDLYLLFASTRTPSNILLAGLETRLRRLGLSASEPGPKCEPLKNVVLGR